MVSKKWLGEITTAPTTWFIKFPPTNLPNFKTLSNIQFLCCLYPTDFGYIYLFISYILL